MERVIQEIQERLRERVADLQTIDENYGQLVKMFDEGADGDIYPLMSPAVLIDVRDVRWTGMRGGCQTGIATVVVTLAIDCYDDTHYEQSQRSKIAERMRLAGAVHWALQGWKPTETTPMVRTSTKLYHLPRLWKAYETTYTCSVVDLDNQNSSG